MVSKKFFSVVNVFVLAIIMLGCNSHFVHKVEKLDHSVIIHQDSTIINIEVVNESIIHVNKIKVGSEPSAIPKQEMLFPEGYVKAVVASVSCVGSVNVIDELIVQPFRSVTITSYVPAVNPVWSSSLITNPEPSSVDQA